ncbi:MAG: DUF3788 domain-containing protein [Candidatus Aminicenantia bacterium]
MSENAFLQKEIVPNDTLVEKKLGLNYQYLKEIRSFIKETLGETTAEWKYYGKKNGWLLKTLYKKRNLFFVNVCDGYFKITFVFGDKAVNAINNEDISQDLKEEVLAARKYAEGRGLTIRVNDDSCLMDIKKLINIKIDN